MAEFSTAGLAASLSGLASAAVLAGLNQGDPGATGAGELSGGSYARVAVAFPAPSGSPVTAPAVTINVPAGVTVDHFSLFSSGGAYLCGGPLSASETYGAAGTYALTPSLSATG
jgi:hypothetical protein